MFNTYFFYVCAGYRKGEKTFVNGVVHQPPKSAVLPDKVMDILITESECRQHYNFDACVVTFFREISKQEFDTYMRQNKNTSKPTIRRVK